MKTYVVIARHGSILGNVAELGIAWRDKGDGCRMSRRVSFQPHEEDRDFSSVTDPGWIEEWTHALGEAEKEGEIVVTFVAARGFDLASRYASRAGTLGDLFPQLRQAVDVRPFVKLTSPKLCGVFDALLDRGFVDVPFAAVETAADASLLGVQQDADGFVAASKSTRVDREKKSIRFHPSIQQTAILLADVVEALTRGEVIPPDPLEARAVAERLRRGGP